MSRQEKILEEISNKAYRTFVGVFPELDRDVLVATGDLLAKIVIRYLHENNVVIKVDKELPEPPFDVSSDTYRWKKQMCRIVQSDMLKAGYVAVEPLIKEEKRV